jgi:hypothetical protein
MSTSRPATRAEFKEFMLRQLGKPVIEINVDNDQVEDAVEIALSYYIDHHFDGAFPTFLKLQLTADNVANGYIDIPEEVVAIRRVMPLGGSSGISNIFSYDYQFTQSLSNELASSYSLIPYFTMRMQYEQIQEMLIGQFPIRYSKHFNKLYLDCNKSKLAEGNYIVAEAYTAINPETQTDIWNDRILQRHATALLKKTWGQSMSKYEGVQLPGGLTMNGRQIYDDAITELQQIEDDYITNYSLPPEDLIM